jgi:hypothetical protein
MPSTITWTPPPHPPTLSNCASFDFLWPLDPGSGQSYPADPLVPVTLVQTCTSFLTSTYNPFTQTFTVSLQGSAWQIRTQTVAATPQTWTTTFVKSYTDEFPNQFFTGDATVITASLSFLTISTNTSRSVISSNNGFHDYKCYEDFGVPYSTCSSISDADPLQPSATCPSIHDQHNNWRCNHYGITVTDCPAEKHLIILRFYRELHNQL